MASDPRRPNPGGRDRDPLLPTNPDTAPSGVTASPGAVLGAIAAGGALGSLARYQVGLAWSTAAGAFPAATLIINVTGCLLIGVLLVLITERPAARQPASALLRPFLGTGVLGGFTTFSTYTVDIHRLFADQRPAVALGYLAVTAIAAVGAAALGVVGARRLLLGRR